MTGRMSKRQGLILAALIVVAIGEVVKVNNVTHHAQLLLDAKIFWAWMSGAATTVVAFLMKSDGHATPEAFDAPRPPAE